MSDSNPFCQCLYYSVNALSRVMTKMAEEEFAFTGLSPSHGFLLMAVNKRPGIQPGELAGQLMLTPSTITRLIEKLESKRLVERTSSGKTIQVRPTPAGKGLQRDLEKAWRALYERYAKVLGKGQSTDITSHLYDAVQKLQKE